MNISYAGSGLKYAMLGTCQNVRTSSRTQRWSRKTSIKFHKNTFELHYSDDWACGQLLNKEEELVVV